MEYRLVLDFGNTALKASIYRDGEVYSQTNLEAPTTEEILAFSSSKPVKCGILGSVVNHSPNLVEELAPLFPLLILGPETALPITNDYKTEETLGYDRIAAAVGAWQLFPGSPVLAIVAGTCITYNIVDKNGNFLGGAISPGMHMRVKSMHDYTKKLPLIKLEGEHPLTGNTTETSLRSGVFNGTVAELEGMIYHYLKQYPGLNTIIGGGDSTVLAEALKNGIFARPNLVAQGLYSILEYHVANHLL
ncbi:MAG TPA: type III pantothenate kinase [Bacteroidia bacterium]|nr:type III pantothenate kinase [Bacteroidia bacterium]